MENKLVLTDNKILEHNEKAFADTSQLFQNLDKRNIEREIKHAEEDPKFKEMLHNLHFDKGRTIWLELEVEDSYLSTLIMAWMYSKSKHDGGSGLHAMGCKLNSIMFQKPSGYSDEAKEAVKRLYNDMFGESK